MNEREERNFLKERNSVIERYYHQGRRKSEASVKERYFQDKKTQRSQ